ncbi:MAG: MFS transporter [Clostridiales bacterium]|nr:MFS transporter [Clostridiales bacterium]
MENRIIKLKSNIWKNYLFMFLRIDFTHGFWMIYLFNKGIDLVYLGLLETLFHVTSFTMEIPTGMIADVFGRKTSRILGRLFFAISNYIILIGDNIFMFALGFMIIAISYNLESGAGEALLYDTLKELKEEEKYLKIIGRIEGIYQLTALISFVVGGWLASHNYSLLYAVTIIFTVIAFFEAFTFLEPNYKSDKSKEMKARDAFRNLVKESFQVIRGNKKIMFFIFSMEFILSIGTVLFYYLQNYWKGQNIVEWKIGLFFALSSLMGMMGGILASRIEKKLGQKRFLLIFPFVTVVSVWIIAMSSLHIIAFIAVTFVDSLIFVGMNDYINREIESHIRATVLSVASMVFSFYMIIIFPVFGSVSDHYNFKTAFLFLAVVSTIALIVNSVIVIKNLE